MKGQRIRIKLQGFDYRVIDQSAQDIVETAWKWHRTHPHGFRQTAHP